MELFLHLYPQWLKVVVPTQEYSMLVLDERLAGPKDELNDKKRQFQYGFKIKQNAIVPWPRKDGEPLPSATSIFAKEYLFSTFVEGVLSNLIDADPLPLLKKNMLKHKAKYMEAHKKLFAADGTEIPATWNQKKRASMENPNSLTYAGPEEKKPGKNSDKDENEDEDDEEGSGDAKGGGKKEGKGKKILDPKAIWEKRKKDLTKKDQFLKKAKDFWMDELHINTRQDSFVLPGETILYPQGPDDIDPDIGRPIPLDAILEYDSRTISSIGCYLTQVLSISLRIHQHIRKLNRKMIRKAGYIEAAEVEAVYSMFANEIQTVYADFKTENSHFR